MKDIMVFAALAHPDDAEMTFLKADESARNLTPYQVEYRINHPHKGIRWIECRSTPQGLPDGGVRWYGFYQDITERKQAEQQLRELAAHIQTVREEEKTRLAREIHDDLGSTLAALNLRLSHILDFEFPEDMKKTPLFTRLESMSQILESAIAASRRIITDMRPDVLDNLGLFAALKWQAGQLQKHSGIACRVICAIDHSCVDCKECEYPLDKTLSINLFRIFQEALSNVARHSGASKVEAEYRPENGVVVLSIRDNGSGLPEGYPPASTSFGIRGMRERVEQLGGLIKFDSPLGGGLCVTVQLPLAVNIKASATISVKRNETQG
jgi:signal transduction histidine kinase